MEYKMCPECDRLSSWNSYFQAYMCPEGHQQKIVKPTMEQKMMDLKEEFCKWYCDGKEETITGICDGDTYCKECETDIYCHGADKLFVSVCDHCKIGDYIRHIRDEL